MPPPVFTSALVSRIVAPQPGDLICDLGAVPGSKTSHMAQIMDSHGIIMVHESVHTRLAMLEYNLKHLGMSNVVTTRYRGQNFRCGASLRGCWSTPCARCKGNDRWDIQGRVSPVRRAPGTSNDVPRLHSIYSYGGLTSLRRRKGNLRYLYIESGGV